MTMSLRFKLQFFLVFALVLMDGSARAARNFLAAADFSDLAFFEARGITYKDGGQVQDALQILKNHGINCVRLRLWTSSAAQAAADPYDYTNNLTYTLPLALRVKNAGLLFSLDFHYSDTWTDPGHQAIPAAWSNGVTLTNLVAQMYTYNSNTIAAFAAAGAMPDYVQVGNEITAGMLWPIGQVSASANGGAQWTNLALLMESAEQGIRDAASAAGQPMPKIIIHIDRGGDWTTTQQYFNNINQQGVPYDIIGESYYPFYQGSLSDLSNCLTNAANTFGKPIIVAETAFPWTNTCPTNWLSDLYGYPPTEIGQVNFLLAEGQVINSVPNGLGAGVAYWGGEYQAASGVNEAGFNTASFWDAGGNLLPSLNAEVSIGAPPTTANLYQEDFGAVAGGGASLTLAQVGWSQVGPSAGGSSAGIYAASNSVDVDTGLSLPPSAAYYYGGASEMGILYTTNGAGSGTAGDSSFTSIDPTLYSNLTFSVETQQSYQGSNVSSWFAVQVGGAWYMSTNKMSAFVESAASADFSLASLVYNPIASNWTNLTIGSSSISLGNIASSNLTGAITGIGIVVTVKSAGSWDYNNLLIRATAPHIVSQPANESVALGGNANFAVSATGAPTLGYQWQFNNANMPGATNSFLFLANVQASNAGPYQVVLTNSYGSVTSAAVLLSVTGVPVSFLTGPAGIQLAGGQFRLALTNLTGQGPVEIDASTNLLQWVPIFTNPSAFGTITLVDTNAGHFPQRYYRAITP
jgi:arabinogalactan endo-1,4-beta-galactosidase